MRARLPFGGHEFYVVGHKALFWPKQRALIFADLHLEKASWFAARGQMLPPHDSLATLTAVTRLIERTDARRIWCLGDNFHDQTGPQRMAPDARALLARLTSQYCWVWITGNHDGTLPAMIGGEIVPEACIDGLWLRHEAVPEDPRPELSGHFHPKHRSRVRGRAVTRPCFVEGPSKLILPSFGALTGGMAATHDAIRAALGQILGIHVPAGEGLVRFAA